MEYSHYFWYSSYRSIVVAIGCGNQVVHKPNPLNMTDL